jgi:hypothetical protein
MNERKTDKTTRGRDTSPVDGRDRDAGDGRHERDKDEFEAGTSYQPSTNQAQDEPLPASHHDDGRQETAQPSDPVRDNSHPAARTRSPNGQDQED